MGNVNSYPVYGLTGGIGSGKSTVAQFFAQRGIPVLDLDAVGHHLLFHDESLRAELCHTFGTSIVQRDHSIDRTRLAQLAFRDAATTKQLNQIVHPRIWQQAEQWQALQQDAPFAVIEASVLIESHACERVDGVMVVLSELALRQQRVLQRGKQNQATFHSIVSRQCSDEQRVQAADHLIYNNGTRKQLQHTVQMLYQQLL